MIDIQNTRNFLRFKIRKAILCLRNIMKITFKKEKSSIEKDFEGIAPHFL